MLGQGLRTAGPGHEHRAGEALAVSHGDRAAGTMVEVTNSRSRPGPPKAHIDGLWPARAWHGRAVRRREAHRSTSPASLAQVQ